MEVDAWDDLSLSLPRVHYAHGLPTVRAVCDGMFSMTIFMVPSAFHPIVVD